MFAADLIRDAVIFISFFEVSRFTSMTNAEPARLLLAMRNIDRQVGRLGRFG